MVKGGAMRWRRRAAGVTVVAVSVAGCASGGESGTRPASATTTAPTTTPTSVPPATPTSVPTATPTTTTVAPPAPTTTIVAPEPIAPAPPEGMELVWSDEFDGAEIDPSNWTYDIGGWGWGNGEAQYYTDRPDNARIENGLLVIELRKEQFDGSYYTSARLKTQGLREFRYGRMEARIKVPAGDGTWPAFWMLGSGFEQDSPDTAKQWPFVGEIDIMEYVGREPDLVLGTVHGPGYAGAGGKSTWFRQEHLIADEFRTFAIDWTSERIQWFYEGEMFAEVTPEDLGRGEWVFDRPFFFILNLALGGSLGGFISPDLDYPIHYYVDYVRVYQPTAASIDEEEDPG